MRNAYIPNPYTPGGRRPVKFAVTDRALRYRAVKNAPPGPRRCHYCGGRRNVEVEHVDGHEENAAAHNLTWACRSCNTIKGVVFRNAGFGRRTRQFNPGAAGAQTMPQWVNAVMTIKGMGGTMDIPAAVDLIHATPQDKRSQFAAEIYDRRRRAGNAPKRRPKQEEVPF